MVSVKGAVPLAPNAGENQTGTVGIPVTFDGSGSQPSGSITSYSWNFGDKSSGSGAIVNHTYAAAGTYPAVLTITANGKTATSDTQVTVVAPPRPVRG